MHADQSLYSFTLVRLVVVVAMLAILISLAAPSLLGSHSRAQGEKTAEATDLDLIYAKSEAIKQNGTITASFSEGASWCSGLASAGAICDCTDQNPACLINGTTRTIDGGDYSGVTLAVTGCNSGNHTIFDGARDRFTPIISAIALTPDSGDRPDIRVAILGRKRICATTTNHSMDHPQCT